MCVWFVCCCFFICCFVVVVFFVSFSFLFFSSSCQILHITITIYLSSHNSKPSYEYYLNVLHMVLVREKSDIVQHKKCKIKVSIADRVSFRKKSLKAK